MKAGLLSFFEKHQEEISLFFNIGCDASNVFRLDNITHELCQIIGATAVVVYGKAENETITKDQVSISINRQIIPIEAERLWLQGQIAANYSNQHWYQEKLNKKTTGRLLWEIRQIIEIELFQTGGMKGRVVALFNTSVINRTAIENLIKMVATKIEYAIERDFAQERLTQQNNELSELHQQLTNKNRLFETTLQELMQTKLSADENNQLKSAFLANLSHEIRTPMNVILGFSELVKSSSCSEQERHNYLDIIHQNGLQLLRIMDNLIDISKLKTRHIINAPNLVSVNKILDRQYEYFHKMIQVAQKPITLKIEKGVAAPQDTILSSDEIIEKVLGHLLDNAVKFTREGEVCFGYEAMDHSFLFYVKDTGIGIPKGKEEVIFDLFRQADINATREFGGNGLGLALARKYLGVLGGKIWVESKPKEGSVFFFTIPLMSSKCSQ